MNAIAPAGHVLAHFKLKEAAEYRFYNRGGQRSLVLLKGQLLEAKNETDVAYFRSRKDVLIETTSDGTPIDELGRRGHLVEGNTRSYKVYGRKSQSQPPNQALQARAAAVQPVAPAGPNRMTVGNPAAIAAAQQAAMQQIAAQQAAQQAPVVQQAPVQAPVVQQAPVQQAASNPYGMTSLPSESGTVRSPQAMGFESPLEVASVDGRTTEVAPRIDPGQPIRPRADLTEL